LSRVDAEPAFVLHRRAWRETSFLVDLLTPSAGRIGAVARGARSPRSAWLGLVEPFRPLRVSWARRGEMATLTGIDADRGIPALSGTALWCGFYANELMLELLPRDDPEAGIFEAYAALLPTLADAGRRAGALRCFEIRVLDALGLLPRLDECATSGRPVDPGSRYSLDPAAGPVPVSDRDVVFDGRVLRALARGEPVAPADAGQARRLTRTLIEYHLDGRKMKTPAMFRENA